VLSAHSGIYIPPIKEPQYLAFAHRSDYLALDEWTRGIVVHDFSAYLRLFAPAGRHHLRGDASTSYLYYPERVIDEVKKRYGARGPDVKIVIVLRDPVARAFSNYLHLRKLGAETRSPAEVTWLKPEDTYPTGTVWAREYVEYGMYSARVAAYLSYFRHVHVALHEDLRDRERFFGDLFHFLGLERPTGETGNFSLNAAGVPRSMFLFRILYSGFGLNRILRNIPPKTKRRLLSFREMMVSPLLRKVAMPAELELKLRRHYRRDIEDLERIIGRDLSAWKHRDLATR
jgi:hypothetical protein